MKKIHLYCLTILGVLLLTAFQQSQESDNKLTIRIESSETAADQYRFTGILSNKGTEEFSGSYQMQTTRKGSSGKSTSSQSGEIKVDAREEAILSSSSVNIQPGDQWEVILSIYGNSLLIATDTIRN